MTDADLFIEQVDPTDPSVPVEEPTPVNRPLFSLTGVLDEATINALQWSLGVKQTRELDTRTIKALQKKLGLQQDGEWGRDLRHALQKYLAVPVTTTFDSRSVRALQKFLVEVTEW